METTNRPDYCTETVRRGGPSSNGGYDALNTTRMEVCGKPSVTTTGRSLCTRHLNLSQRKADEARHLHAMQQAALAARANQ